VEPGTFPHQIRCHPWPFDRDAVALAVACRPRIVRIARQRVVVRGPEAVTERATPGAEHDGRLALPARTVRRVERVDVQAASVLVARRSVAPGLEPVNGLSQIRQTSEEVVGLALEGPVGVNFKDRRGALPVRHVELPLRLSRLVRRVAPVGEIRLPPLHGPVRAVRRLAGGHQIGECRPVVRPAAVSERLPDQSMSRLPTSAPVEPETHLLLCSAWRSSVDGAPDQRMDGATSRSVAQECGAAVHGKADARCVHVQPFGCMRCLRADGKQARDSDDG
jgi:hypothetical protein